jgi:hypothetical protein
MRFLLFISFLIIQPYICFSQEDTKIILWGLIIDTNNNPVSNTNISILNTSIGATTNTDGFFYIPIKKQITRIQVSHINYYQETIVLNKLNFDHLVNDTIKINVILKPKINLLESFEILSEKIELLFHKSFISILDFQFYEDNLLLLLKEKNSIKLRLTNSKSDKISEAITPSKTKNIYRDCFGNLHLLNADSSYQIYFNSLEINLIYGNRIEKYNEVLKPCIAQFNDRIIFIEFGTHSQSIGYFYFNKFKEKKYVKKIRNTATEKYATQTVMEVKYLENILERRSLGIKTQDQRPSYIIDRLIFQETNFYEKVLTKPLYAPLFTVNNNLYLFDHVRDSCFVFDENLNQTRSFYIDYHQKINWTKKLIVDKEQGTVYAKFEKNGFCYLKKIDLQTGKIIESYKLEKQTFPSKIKIKNNTAYYLYKDRFNHGQMSLFKQSLH